MCKDLAQLRENYMELVNTRLPDAAKTHEMPIHLNHCFARVLLDHVFQDCWYKHLSRDFPAYKQLDVDQLGKAIELGIAMLRDPDVCHALNRQSLAWRGKLRQ